MVVVMVVMVDGYGGYGGYGPFSESKIWLYNVLYTLYTYKTNTIYIYICNQ